mgnify:CR=1 FL=1
MSTTELIEQHWKSRFLVLDFWPSLVYYGVYACILFIWRPTYNSYLLIVSSQVGTDEDAEMNTNNEFELNNLGNEFNINDDDDNDSFVGHFVAEDGPSDNRNDEETQIENKKSLKPSNDESGNAFKIDDDDEDDSDGEGKENPFSDSNKLIEDKK